MTDCVRAVLVGVLAPTQTRRESGLMQKQPEPFVEIHPRHARRRGIASDDRVEVLTRRGRIQLRALVSRRVGPGCLWIPLHFPDARANLFTNDVGDHETGTAAYEVSAAEVVKLEFVDGGPPRYPGGYNHEDGPGPGRVSAAREEET